VLENLEVGIVEFEIVEKFLEEIKKKFGRGDNKSKKVTESKQVK